MKKKLHKILGCAVFAFFVCLFTPSNAKAAVKIFPEQKTNPGIFSANVDMNHDGKTETITVKTKSDSDGYIDYLALTMNGKVVYSPSMTERYCYKLTTRYFKMSNNREFIQLLGIGLSDYPCLNQIIVYDHKTQKMHCINTLTNKKYTSFEVMAATKNRIVIRHTDQPAETGSITWAFEYKYKNGKFILASSAGKKVKTMTANLKKNKYSKYFAKNQFIAAKKLTFYKSYKNKKKAFRLKKGKVVTLKGLRIYKGKMYLQFKYHKKKGWIRVNTRNYNYGKPWFKDIRYAG